MDIVTKSLIEVIGDCGYEILIGINVIKAINQKLVNDTQFAADAAAAAPAAAAAC